MATYYVDGSNGSNGNGSSGNPWKTLALAHAGISAGDTVRVRAGTYQEQLSITKANTTWIADNPAAKPVVDGRWNVSLMSGGNTLTTSSKMPRIDSAPNYLPPGTNSKQGLIQITAAGVMVDGFASQNSTGSGISIGASNCTVQNCVTYFTYSSGILSNPGSKVTGISILNNVIRFASIKIFDPERFTDYAGSCSAQCVDGSLKVGKNNGGTLIQGNDIAFGFGEGINIGKNNSPPANDPIIVEGNRVHDVNHSYIYINGSVNVIVRKNLCYCTGVELNMWDGDPPAGIRLKDEVDTVVRDVQVYNNVVVNLGQGLDWGDKHTSATGVYVGHNTFVGGPETEVKQKAAILIKQNKYTHDNQKGIFENNIIDHSTISTSVLSTNNATGNAGVTLRNNNWSKQPTPSGTADVVANPKLVNAGANLSTSNYPNKTNTTWASVTTSDNFNLNNYKLTSTSPGRGAASSGVAASGVTPPNVSTDYLGNARDATKADRDVGAIEYGATGPVVGDVTAAFTFTPTGGDAPILISFTDASIEEDAAAIDGWAWDFGDGVSTSTLQNPTHTYTEYGVYTVRLTVSDSALGISDTTTHTITITSTPTPTVTASFDTEGIRVGHAPLTVKFRDLSGGPVSTWAWDFGDGSTSSAQNPVHIYTVAGLYDVSLTVTDGGAATDSLTEVEYIQVTSLNFRRFIVGPFPVRDIETPAGNSVTNFDSSDDADPTGLGYQDVATNRRHPGIYLSQQAAEPEAVEDGLVLWLDEDGTLKAKLPDDTVKTITWT